MGTGQWPDCVVAVKMLLDTGKAAADSKDNECQMPLWWAATLRHEDAVDLSLVTGNVDVNSIDDDDDDDDDDYERIALS